MPQNVGEGAELWGGMNDGCIYKQKLGVLNFLA